MHLWRSIKPVLVLMVLSSMIIWSPAAFADDAFQKLGRGIANTASGWLEIYHQMEETTKKDGPLAGVTTGSIKGVLKATYRTLIGAYETATFFIPVPAGYEPIIYPEYIPLKSGYAEPHRSQ